MQKLIFFSSVLSLFIVFSLDAMDVGFAEGEFFLKTDIEWAEESDEQDFFRFSLCPTGLPEGNVNCFNLSTCSFSKSELQEELNRMVDENQRAEFEMMLIGSFVSKFTLEEYLETHIQIVKRLSEQKKCVVVTELARILSLEIE